MRVCLHPCRCGACMRVCMLACTRSPCVAAIAVHCALCTVNESDVVVGGSLPVHPRLRAFARACVRARVRSKIKESRKVIRT